MVVILKMACRVEYLWVICDCIFKQVFNESDCECYLSQLSFPSAQFPVEHLQNSSRVLHCMNRVGMLINK